MYLKPKPRGLIHYPISNFFDVVEIDILWSTAGKHVAKLGCPAFPTIRNSASLRLRVVHFATTSSTRIAAQAMLRGLGFPKRAAKEANAPHGKLLRWFLENES